MTLKTFPNAFSNFGFLLLAVLFTVSSFAQTTTLPPAPELIFNNPVLVKGIAGTQGAEYLFSNVTTGTDAKVVLKKFSRQDIVMADVDLSNLGWDKAFQPQFGLAGLVQPNQNWYVDFEMQFLEAGKNIKKKVQRFDLTSLDVDGDGWSIQEYITVEKPDIIGYSPASYLSGSADAVNTLCHVCEEDSPLATCATCGGTGVTGISTCATCEGSGKVHSLCGHSWDGSYETNILGPVDNFANIDTAATQVMATYTFLNKDVVRFKIGAKSGAGSSNGSGIRLNSMWFRSFRLTPMSVLPVTTTAFSATANGKDVLLKWTTRSEKNFSHFVIERSADGKSYSAIGLLYSDEDVKEVKNYSFKDAGVATATGVLYYRLRQVDKTGEVCFSTVKVIKLNKEENQVIAISTYPNPVSDQLKISLPNSWQRKTVTISLYNSVGILLQQVKAGNANHTETLSLHNLPKGFYLVKASCENSMARQQVIKN